MIDHEPNSDGSAHNDSTPSSASSSVPPGDPNPHAGGPGPAASDVDHEVAAAMADMDPADVAELCGGTSSALESSAPASVSASCGDKLIGTVAIVTGEEIFLEFDAKSQGVLPRSQFGEDETVEPGMRVEVVVDRVDAESNLLLVHKEGAIVKATWENLEKDMIVEGRVTGMVKGGLEVNLSGIRGFMPASQVDVAPLKDISVLLNEVVRCQVMEVNRRGKNVLVSRRKVLAREREEQKEKLLAELEVGQIRDGVVGNIAEFGAFIDLGGVDGLIHIRDLSWGTVDKVSDVLAPGQEVRVQILKVDSSRERISLGLKHTQTNPWIGVEERYAVGAALKGRIIRVVDFGAFVELEPGIEALIPISEMGWTHVRTSAEAVSVGQVVDAVVIRVEAARHRIAVSMKQAEADPWEGVLESFEEQSLVTGRVTRLADFGAFVELVPGVEGLIHISELSTERVRTCADVVQPGQEVETRVLGVDKENRRISLSIKAVTAPTTHVVEEPPAQPKTPKKRKKPLRGGLSSHFNW